MPQLMGGNRFIYSSSIGDLFYYVPHFSNTHSTVKTELKLSERTYSCSNCHKDEDRDVNAAINIRQEVVRLLKEEKNIQVMNG